MTAARYPLAWPLGWKRTPSGHRRRARFKTTAGIPNTYQRTRELTIAEATDRLGAELRRLGVQDRDWLISSNVEVRLDGLPYSNRRAPEDPGVAVYFRLRRQDRCLACDTWDRVADNIAAVAAHIDCLRGIDRYGVGTLEQAFAGYAALPPKGSTWRTTLGFAIDQVVTAEDIHAAKRRLAREVHPDVAGGSHDAMASLTEAVREGLEELGGADA